MSILFYNGSNGDGAISTLDDAGSYAFAGPLSGFSLGWTHIVAA